MDRLQKLLVLITFVLGIGFMVAFAFKLIPEETFNQLQAYLNINLDSYLSNLTAYTGAGFAVSTSGLIARSVNNRNEKLFSAKLSGETAKYKAELEKVKKYDKDLINTLTAKTEAELDIKNQEVKALKDQNKLLQEQVKIEKQKVMNIKSKNYRL